MAGESEILIHEIDRSAHKNLMGSLMRNRLMLSPSQ